MIQYEHLLCNQLFKCNFMIQYETDTQNQFRSERSYLKYFTQILANGESQT